MEWEDTNNRVIYKLQGMGWYNTSELQPYKEETMEEQKAIPSYMDYDVRTKEPKELLVGFTKDNNGDWILNTHKDYEIKEENGKFKLIKKQPQHPNTFADCCRVVNNGHLLHLPTPTEIGYKGILLHSFQQLLICRDAYWKIAGDWKPDWNNGNETKYCIYITESIISFEIFGVDNQILAFPIEEMRDEFYNNFKELIEQCKELL